MLCFCFHVVHNMMRFLWNFLFNSFFWSVFLNLHILWNFPPTFMLFVSSLAPLLCLLSGRLRADTVWFLFFTFIKIFYRWECVLYWWLFCVSLRTMCVFCFLMKYSKDVHYYQLINGVEFNHVFIDFLPPGPLHFWGKVLKSSTIIADLCTSAISFCFM